MLARLKTPRLPQKVKDILTPEEIAQVVGSLNPHTEIGARDQAIFLVLLDSGMRALRALQLCRCGDLHLNEGYVKVYGKNKKERPVRVGSYSVKAIRFYLLHWRKPARELIDHVFLTCRGVTRSVGAMAPDPGEPLRPKAVEAMIKRIGTRGGCAAPASAPAAAHLLVPLPDDLPRSLRPQVAARAHHAGDDQPLRRRRAGDGDRQGRRGLGPRRHGPARPLGQSPRAAALTTRQHHTHAQATGGVSMSALAAPELEPFRGCEEERRPDYHVGVGGAGMPQFGDEVEGVDADDRIEEEHQQPCHSLVLLALRHDRVPDRRQYDT